MNQTSGDRPPWDDYFMDITFQVAKRGTCDRARVGAIGHLMIAGHCMRTLHAEQNAIIQAALHGISLAGGAIYVTHQPCLTCAKMIINAGLKRVVYAGHYPDENAVAFLREAGVAFEHWERPLPPSEAETDDDNVPTN
jgi:dCMP deaminase